MPSSSAAGSVAEELLGGGLRIGGAPFADDFPGAFEVSWFLVAVPHGRFLGTASAR
jgi:hypothetical protein